MRKLTALFMAAILILASGVSRGQEFPADQFGKVDLAPTQSTADLIETIGAAVDRFEPMSDFSEDDPFRQLGRTVGRLQMLIEKPDGSQVVGTCTATLIAVDRLLTNNHCIPGKSGRVIASLIHFGYVDMGGSSAEKYEVNPQPLETGPSLDYTILEVLGRPGEKYGHVRLSPRIVKPNERLMLIHHPAGQPQKLTRAFCRALTQDPVVDHHIRHKCDTLGGSSGALIFSQLDYAFVGLHNLGGLSALDQNSFNQGIEAISLVEAAPLLREICCANSSIPHPTTARANGSAVAEPELHCGGLSMFKHPREPLNVCLDESRWSFSDPEAYGMTAYSDTVSVELFYDYDYPWTEAYCQERGVTCVASTVELNGTPWHYNKVEDEGDWTMHDFSRRFGERTVTLRVRGRHEMSPPNIVAQAAELAKTLLAGSRASERNALMGAQQ